MCHTSDIKVKSCIHMTYLCACTSFCSTCVYRGQNHDGNHKPNSSEKHWHYREQPRFETFTLLKKNPYISFYRTLSIHPCIYKYISISISCYTAPHCGSDVCDIALFYFYISQVLASNMSTRQPFPLHSGFLFLFPLRLLPVNALLFSSRGFSYIFIYIYKYIKENRRSCQVPPLHSCVAVWALLVSCVWCKPPLQFELSGHSLDSSALTGSQSPERERERRSREPGSAKNPPKCHRFIILLRRQNVMP